MNNFKIHWKGCPCRRLPCAQVASSRRTSAQSCSIAHAAVENPSQHPLGAALEKERNNYRSRLRSRRGRSWCSSAKIRARERVPVKDQCHVQVFEWNTVQVEAASEVTTSHGESQHPLVDARTGAILTGTTCNTAARPTLINSNDGAAASDFRMTKAVQIEALYSLMHVAEHSVCSTSSKTANQIRSSIVSSRAASRSSKRAEYAHVGSIGTVSKRTDCTSQAS